MEGDAIGVEAEVAGAAQQLDRHLRSAAEFARQRPLGTVAGDEDAAEYLCAGCGARQLLELESAVEGEQPQPRLIGEGDVLFLFDRVAEGQTIGGDAVGEAELDLAAARHVEIGALALEHGDDLRAPGSPSPHSRRGRAAGTSAADRKPRRSRRDRRRGTASRGGFRQGSELILSVIVGVILPARRLSNRVAVAARDRAADADGSAGAASVRPNANRNKADRPLRGGIGRFFVA